MRSALRLRTRTRPSEWSVPSTAATWPWGGERRMATAAPGRRQGHAAPQGGVDGVDEGGRIFARFATVLLRIRFPSRRRMAGGEDRFGMASTLRARGSFLVWQHDSSTYRSVSAERLSLFRDLRDAVGKNSAGSSFYVGARQSALEIAIARSWLPSPSPNASSQMIATSCHLWVGLRHELPPAGLPREFAIVLPDMQVQVLRRSVGYLHHLLHAPLSFVVAAQTISICIPVSVDRRLHRISSFLKTDVDQRRSPASLYPQRGLGVGSAAMSIKFNCWKPG